MKQREVDRTTSRSKTMGDWDKVGETNGRLADGDVVADKRTSKDPAHLVSKEKYKDFQIYVELWASDDGTSWSNRKIGQRPGTRKGGAD